MTGADFRKWVENKGYRPAKIAADLDISISTLYKWYKKPNLDIHTWAILSQIVGFPTKHNGIKL